jgi:EAL domain-containing protein (putative c-di-GMP-specific phosphodiesterase class I)
MERRRLTPGATRKRAAICRLKDGLEWLRRLPLTGVKIPGAFVEGLAEERRSQAIVARVIDLAHDLGLRVVAEEVETEAQRDFLAGRGCDLYQGYLFYAPMPAGELVRAFATTDGAPDATRS